MLIASKDVTERLRAERELRTALAENASLRKELERERDYCLYSSSRSLRPIVTRLRVV